jgi:hypothetical protein
MKSWWYPDLFEGFWVVYWIFFLTAEYAPSALPPAMICSFDGGDGAAKVGWRV